MSFREVLFESPLIQEILAGVRQESILQALEVRFGVVPPEILLAIRTVTNLAELLELVGVSATCPDLSAFQQQLSIVIPKEATECPDDPPEPTIVLAPPCSSS